MEERGSDAETDMGDACFFSRPWHREFFCAEWAHCNTHRLQVNDQPILMYETPEEALSSMTESPLLPEVNRLSLSCKGGRPEHDIQLYLRLAKENDGTILTSPYATLYNFSPTQDEAAFAMNDVLDLDEASNYDLVLFELITYKKAAAPKYQYAVFR